MLRSDGLGAVSFGDDAARVVTVLTDALGVPDEDTGWTDPFSEFGTCPGDAVRGVRWSGLQTLFVSNGHSDPLLPPGRTFFNYSLTDIGEGGLGLMTKEGVGVGSSVAQLKAAYEGRVSIAVIEWLLEIAGETVYGFYTDGWSEEGVVSGPNDWDVVERISAGGSCGE